MARLIAKALVYAPGGGTGHLMRARVIRQELQAAGITTSIFAQPSGKWLEADGAPQQDWRPLSEAPAAIEAGSEYLYVDTFPLGISGELTPRLLARCKKKVFIARYSRSTDWSSVVSCYDEILDPYPQGLSEWGGMSMQLRARCRSIGYLLRSDRPRVSHVSNLLTVLDPGSRLSSDLRRQIQKIAEERSFRTQYIERFSDHIEGAKILSIGAGYNLFYELLAAGADFRCVPLKRRHDDQVARAVRFGRRVHTFNDVGTWLRRVPTRLTPPSVNSGPGGVLN